MRNRVFTPRESVIQATGNFILDFRKWLIPETKLLSKWKTQEFAYVYAEGRMIDDVTKMLDSMRKKSVDLPILCYAIRQISAPPELSHIIGVPQEIKTIIKADPLKRRVFLRTEPRIYHVQFVFLSNDVDSANAFTSQFCSYIRLMEKRRFEVEYYLSPELKDNWHLTIIDNTIYPDTAVIDETNITAGILDFEFAGLTPRVTKGLPPLYPDDYGSGSGSGGDANNPNHPNHDAGGEEGSHAWGLVTEANMFPDRNTPTYERLKVDPETGERTSETIEK